MRRAHLNHCYLGPLIGRRLQQLHEENGVKFLMDSEVGEMLGDEEGKLTEVVLTSGRTLKADILVAGLGVLPSTDFLRDSDIILDSRGFIPVDEVTFSYLLNKVM